MSVMWGNFYHSTSQKLRTYDLICLYFHKHQHILPWEMKNKHFYGHLAFSWCKNINPTVTNDNERWLCEVLSSDYLEFANKAYNTLLASVLILKRENIWVSLLCIYSFTLYDMTACSFSRYNFIQIIFF